MTDSEFYAFTERLAKLTVLDAATRAKLIETACRLRDDAITLQHFVADVERELFKERSS